MPVLLSVRRCRRIAAVLLLRRAKELVLCVERIAANGVTLAATRAILALVAWRADMRNQTGAAAGFIASLVYLPPGGPNSDVRHTPIAKTARPLFIGFDSGRRLQ